MWIMHSSQSNVQRELDYFIYTITVHSRESQLLVRHNSYNTIRNALKLSLKISCNCFKMGFLLDVKIKSHQWIILFIYTTVCCSGFSNVILLQISRKDFLSQRVYLIFDLKFFSHNEKDTIMLSIPSIGMRFSDKTLLRMCLLVLSWLVSLGFLMKFFHRNIKNIELHLLRQNGILITLKKFRTNFK